MRKSAKLTWDTSEMIKIGVNGFGRMGRMIVRAMSGAGEFQLVGINDLSDPKTLGHLLLHDSIHGRFEQHVGVDGQDLLIGEERVRVLAEKDPSKLPWKELGADIVLESTGKFTDRDKAAVHLAAGAKFVVVSAPSKGADATLVMGVNHNTFDPEEHKVVSNASCTTNAAAPVVKVLHEKFGIRRGLLTTIHSYTNDQHLLDLPHKDLRRTRAAALNMIPTSTGAAVAIGLVLPELVGRFDGVAIRVPTPNVSLVDFTFELEKEASAENVNHALADAAKGPLVGILGYTEEELVSSDFNGIPASSTVDAKLTRVVADLVKVFAWYDNEWGYGTRCVDVMRHMAKRAGLQK